VDDRRLELRLHDDEAGGTLLGAQAAAGVGCGEVRTASFRRRRGLMRFATPVLSLSKGSPHLRQPAQGFSTIGISR
jgi:hypothetical protein